MARRSSRASRPSQEPQEFQSEEAVQTPEVTEESLNFQVSEETEGSLPADEAPAQSEALKKAAERVCKIIDPMTPRLLIECSPEQLDQKVREIFKEVDPGHDWSQVDINEFYSLWDLRKAAMGHLRFKG